MQSKHVSESLAARNSSTRSGYALACSDDICFNHSVKHFCWGHVLQQYVYTLQGDGLSVQHARSSAHTGQHTEANGKAEGGQPCGCP